LGVEANQVPMAKEAVLGKGVKELQRAFKNTFGELVFGSGSSPGTGQSRKKGY